MNIDDLAGRPTITVPECAQVLGIGKNAAYQAATRGEIPTLRIGHSIRVPVPKLLELLGATTTDPEQSEGEPASSPVAVDPTPPQGVRRDQSATTQPA